MRPSPWIGWHFLWITLCALLALPGNALPASAPASFPSLTSVPLHWDEALLPSYLESKPAPDLDEEEAFLTEPVNELPPVIRPPQDEIRKKVILEWKELQKGLAPDSGVSYDIPIVVNEQVEYFLDYFQTKIRKRFSLWLARSSQYTPMIKQIMREHGLPEDLVYLAMIESGFSTKAYSRAHAAGMWQFIRETGQRYGLKINAWVDERKDPIKSTRAAARYLSDLFNQFGSWYLAAAGYNAGEGKIAKALTMYNAQNYWEITAEHCRYIKDETKQYVPKMIAAALIAKEPEKYGFVDIPYQAPLAYEEVNLPGSIELKDVAAAAGSDLATLVELNPELKRWITPPTTAEYTLRLPSGSKGRLMENYAQLIQPKPRIVYAQHKVKKGERFSTIARRYGVSSRTIAKVNRVRLVTYPTPGTLLLIPQRNGHDEPADEEREKKNGLSKRQVKRSPERKTVVLRDKGEDKENQRETHRLRYRVRKGDSLSSIAQQHDVTIEQIKKWNPRLTDRIQAGRTVTLFVTKDSGGEEKVRTEKVRGSKSSRPRTWMAAEQGEKIQPSRKSGRKPTREVASGLRNLD